LESRATNPGACAVAAALGPYLVPAAVIVGTGALIYGGYELWKGSKHKDDRDEPKAQRKPYEHNKPGRKRQGRETDQEKERKPGWKWRSPPREPPIHTPSKEHQRKRR
jgi:hypothetical protein